MLSALALMRPVVVTIFSMEATASAVLLWMAPICLEMLAVADEVCADNALTSVATTANPFPYSPARTASMVAFSASMLVLPAIEVISATTSPMESGLGQAGDQSVGIGGGCCRLVGDGGGLADPFSDGMDLGGQFFGGGGDGVDAVGGLAARLI